MSGIELVAERPVPGHPRDYEFPETARTSLSNGLRVVVTPMPGRALIAASLVIRAGAGDEPAGLGGATVLSARALTEGTEVRDAIELTEAAERLGASIHAEAGWDATFAGLDVPASRLTPALDLLAEVLRRPAFPEREVVRLRDERLTDLLQAKADPRRRAEEAFVAAIYAPSSPYYRPAGGLAETVERLGADDLRAIHDRGFDPAVRPSSWRARSIPMLCSATSRRCSATGPRLHRRSPPARSTTPRRSAAASCTSSIGQARSRPRSGSATRRCPAAIPTSTRCR